jgi:hypothetical protein
MFNVCRKPWTPSCTHAIAIARCWWHVLDAWRLRCVRTQASNEDVVLEFSIRQELALKRSYDAIRRDVPVPVAIGTVYAIYEAQPVSLQSVLVCILLVLLLSSSINHALFTHCSYYFSSCCLACPRRRTNWAFSGWILVNSVNRHGSTSALLIKRWKDTSPKRLHLVPAKFPFGTIQVVGSRGTHVKDSLNIQLLNLINMHGRDGLSVQIQGRKLAWCEWQATINCRSARRWSQKSFPCPRESARISQAPLPMTRAMLFP